MARGPVSTEDQLEFSDQDFRLFAKADQSKKVDFDLSGLTTATKRTWTAPNKSGTVAMTSDITAPPTAAAQSDQETATSTTTYVSPGRQQFHPSAAKFWASVTGDGATINASYNLTSKTDNGTADLTLTIGTDFSSATYAYATGPGGTTGNTNRVLTEISQAAGVLRLGCVNFANNAADPSNNYYVTAFGDQ